MLSNGVQAEILKDWPARWKLTPNDLQTDMDDMVPTVRHP